MKKENVVKVLSGKIPKADVDYSDNGRPNSHCSLCYHYKNATTCDIIAGTINPAGWCIRFRRAVP